MATMKPSHQKGNDGAMAFTKKGFRLGWGLAFGTIALGALMAIGSSAKASTTAVALSADDFVAQGCELAKQSRLQERDLNLWRCGTTFHGQIASAQAGDLVYVADWSGNKLTGDAYVPVGSTYANTVDVRGNEADLRACGRIANTGVSNCN